MDGGQIELLPSSALLKLIYYVRMYSKDMKKYRRFGTNTICEGLDD